MGRFTGSVLHCTQVVKGIISVKWVSYGWRYMALLLAEHLLFMALVVAYLVLVTGENEKCMDRPVVSVLSMLSFVCECL